MKSEKKRKDKKKKEHNVKHFNQFDFSSSSSSSPLLLRVNIFKQRIPNRPIGPRSFQLFVSFELSNFYLLIFLTNE